MLNMQDPRSQHIIHATVLLDGLLRFGQEMSVAPSAVRIELLEKCKASLQELRTLFDGHFSTRTLIPLQIESLESGLASLAALGTSKDRRNGEGFCPVCSTRIKKINAYAGSRCGRVEWVVFCQKCDESFMPALLALGSSDGFGTG